MDYLLVPLLLQKRVPFNVIIDDVRAESKVVPNHGLERMFQAEPKGGGHYVRCTSNCLVRGSLCVILQRLIFGRVLFSASRIRNDRDARKLSGFTPGLPVPYRLPSSNNLDQFSPTLTPGA